MLSIRPSRPALPRSARRAAAAAGLGLAGVLLPCRAWGQEVPVPRQPAVPPQPAVPQPDTVVRPAPDTAVRPAPDTAPPVALDSARTAPLPARGAAAAAPPALAAAAAAPAFARERLLRPPALPLVGGSPAEVLHVQVLLDGAGFAPGMLDGRWGENMRLALAAFRESAELPADARDAVDAATYARLSAAAQKRPAVTTYVVSAADVRGPYRPVPESIEGKSRADCLCYESLLERLSERFHTRQPVLRALNAGVDFGALRAGDRLTVPNTWRLPPARRVARVVVDKDEGAVRGLDAADRVVFWLPATVGSGDMPSPSGRLRVAAVERNPTYRWDPAVLRDVSRRHPVRYLPSGPNSLVGLVWVALSRPHVGIHGTPTPETVGYAASHGCVRLTNWDALWFSGVARPGLAVQFR